MRKLVRSGKDNPANRAFANALTSRCPPKAWHAEIRTLFEFVQHGIRYALDINGTEVLQTPDVTLCNGYGDCDDKCILLATLLECTGHPAKLLALGFEAERSFSHVIVLTAPAGEGNWISLDATEDHPMGWYPPGVRWQMECDI